MARPRAGRRTRGGLPEHAALSDDPLDLEHIDRLSPAEGDALLARSRPLRNVRERLRGGETIAWSEWRREPRDERFDDPKRLAEFLLYREIMRRPVRANSAEALGLLQLQMPQDVMETSLPKEAETLNLGLEDWKDLLRLLLTHFLRTNIILDFPAQEWMRWIDRRQSQIAVQRRRDPNSPMPKHVRFWPGPFGKPPTRVVRLLAQALQLDLGDRAVQQDIENLLDAAWNLIGYSRTHYARH